MRMMGDGQKPLIRADLVGSRRRATPQQPGEAWGPTGSGKRRYGTAYPRVVLEVHHTSAWRRRQPDTTGGGLAQAATVPGTPRGYADVSPDGGTVGV